MARIGWVPCGVCGNPEASLSENPTGTLSVQCHKCQFSGFGKAGTKAARTLRAQMTPDDDAPAAPPPPKPKAPAPELPATRAIPDPKPKPAAPAPKAPAAVGLLESL